MGLRSTSARLPAIHRHRDTTPRRLQGEGLLAASNISKPDSVALCTRWQVPDRLTAGAWDRKEPTLQQFCGQSADIVAYTPELQEVSREVPPFLPFCRCVSATPHDRSLCSPDAQPVRLAKAAAFFLQPTLQRY